MQQRQHLARVLKALADETRLHLIAELAIRGELTCGEFAQVCACANSTLTYHQHVLSEAGLLQVRRLGQFRVMTLQRETLDAALPGFLERLTGQVSEPVSPAHGIVPTPPQHSLRGTEA
jgi:DNA-binding transcriptional ArsR family regulator